MPDRTANVLTDIETLERAIEEVLAMLDRVSKYVEAVIEEEAPPSSALGQFLLNALALAPKVDPSDIERDLYVLRGIVRLACANWKQQQPYPGRPSRFLSCEHDTHTNRLVKQVGDSSTDAGRRRWLHGQTNKWHSNGRQPKRRWWTAWRQRRTESINSCLKSFMEYAGNECINPGIKARRSGVCFT